MLPRPPTAVLGSAAVDAGAVLIVILLVFVLPPAFLIGGGVISALIGWAAKTTAERQNEGSELIETNY